MTTEITEEYKENLRKHLHSGVVNISFEKKDGTVREMLATLNHDLVEQAEGTPKGEGKAKTDTIQSVFDVEANGWRSFRWDSLIGIDVS